MSQALTELQGNEFLCYDGRGALMSVDTLYDWYEESKALIKFCKEFQAQLKEEVVHRGPLPLERLPEMKIALVAKEGRASINAERAMPVLMKYFSAIELGKFVTVPKGAMVKALESKTEAGSKKGRVNALLRELGKDKALTRGESTRVLSVIGG